jgi:hypothetical protein
MSESIHTARWIGQVADQGWDIHLLPCDFAAPVHSQLRNITVHRIVYGDKPDKSNDVDMRGFYFPFKVKEMKAASALQLGISTALPGYVTGKPAKIIRKLKPDIIHSLEFQHAGYSTLEAKKRLGGKFPKWIASNWGSDIYLFGRMQEHVSKIRDVLANCDYYDCECVRDLQLARDFGFRGEALPVIPNTGGFDLERISKFRKGKPSERRLIMIKGYQHWAGRALAGLRALERCSDMLHGYTVVVYNVFGEDVRIAAELFSNSTSIPVKIIPGQGATHEELLALHGQARISIGLSISDAISTSFLEALVTGSFPIQSETSCANEWVEDGRSGILVPPEDPDIIEQAIRRALSDDRLVDEAAEENWKTAVERLDGNMIKKKAVESYNHILGK